MPKLKRATWECGLLVALGLLVMRYFWGANPLGVMHDDTCYMLTALGWLGEMSMDEAPGRAIGPSLMVLPYLAIFPEATESARWVPTVLSLISLLLVYAQASRMLGAQLALPLTLGVLLSPAFLTSSCNVMGEPLLNFLIWISLLLTEQLDSHWKRVGLALCLLGAIFSRSEGIALSVAALVTLALPRVKRQPKLLIPIGVLGVAALGWFMADSGLRVHLAAIKLIYSRIGSPWDYTVGWWSIYFQIVGGKYLLATGATGFSQFVGAAITLVAVVGWFRLPNQGSALFLKALIATLMAALFLWPYPGERYFLAVWPILLILSTLALPEKFRPFWCWGLIAVLALLALPRLHSAMNWQQKGLEHKERTFQWLGENTPQEARLLVEFPCRYHLLTRREPLPFNDQAGFADLIQHAAEQDEFYVVVENNALLRDVTGKQYFVGLPRMVPWLELYPGAELVHTNQAPERREADLIFRVQGDPRLKPVMADFTRALEVWEKNPEEAEALLRKAREESPQLLSFVDSNLATLLLQTGRGEEAKDLLGGVLSTYPCDLNSLLNLASYEAQQGDHDRARALLQAGIKLGRQWGERSVTQAMEQLLNQI